MNETQIKAKLQELAKNGFRLSTNDNLSQLIEEMLAHLGSTDNFLRDDLIYYTFADWILGQKIISTEKLHEILQNLLSDQHLFHLIGERDTDSIFGRSFSVLLIPLFLMAHQAQPFLSNNEISQIKEKLLQYLKEEKDHRGFVPEKGWAHSTAHTADALTGLAECSELSQSDLQEILAAIRATICTDDGVYTHGEDERLVTAAIAVIKRNLLPEAAVIQWLEGFASPVLAINAMPQALLIRANAKNFLQSLYFRLGWDALAAPFSASISETLKKINFFISQTHG